MSDPGTDENSVKLTKIEVKRDDRLVHVRFDDGAQFTLSHELLRVESPSADVQGHSPSQKVTVGGKRHVQIDRLEPVGNYALRLIFDDGHSTGLYTWPWLYRLGRDQEQLWADYLKSLKEKNLSRD